MSNNFRAQLRVLGTLGVAAFALAGCGRTHDEASTTAAIVGAWVVKIPDAPFPLHMFVFHSDGTVEQSNPDAGDPSTSDSNLMGAWRTERSEVKGKLVEITADRATHRLATRGEISFALKITGNTFDGVASAVFFDGAGRRVRGPLEAKMEGERVRP